MKSVRLLIAHEPYFVQRCAVDRLNLSRSDDCRWPGIVAESMGQVLRSLHIPYTLVEPWNLSEFTTVFAAIDRGDVDCIVNAFGLSLERMEKYDFTYPVFPATAGFVMAKLPASYWQHLTRFLNVFTWQVLLLVGAIAILFVLLSNISRRWTKSMLAHNLLLLLTGFTMMMFTNMYEGLILGSLLTETTAKLQGFDDLIEHLGAHKLQFIEKDPGYLFPTYVKESQNIHFRRLRAAMQHNPFLYESNYTKLIEMLLNEGRYVHMAYTSIKMLTMDVEGADEKQCKLAWIPLRKLGEVMSEQTYLSFPCRKGFHHLPKINERLKLLQDQIYGKMDYWTNEEELADACKRKANKDKNHHHLAFLDTVGIFCLLVGCLFVSCIVAAVEKLYKSCFAQCKTTFSMIYQSIRKYTVWKRIRVFVLT